LGTIGNITATSQDGWHSAKMNLLAVVE